jgi:uncharacterized membrane protein
VSENRSKNGESDSKRKSAISAILIGIGIAGLIDIIIFHAILQWHHTSSHMITPNTIESLQINILHDGVFLTFSLIITISGIIILWVSQSSKNKDYFLSYKRSFIGLVFIGFGGFNTIEGIINHHILQMHHVIEVADPFIFDLTFLVIGGLAFLTLGALMLKSQKVKLKN